MSRTLLIILVFTLTACQSKNLKQTEGQPPAYRQGDDQGCDSGYVAAGHPYYNFTKDVNRFSSDSLYQQGWTDGFNICKAQYEAIQRY